MKSKWEEVKEEGSLHYHNTGSIEPIDLYKSLGILKHWIIGEICQHALRNRDKVSVSSEDMKKIIHYAKILRAAYGSEEEKNELQTVRTGQEPMPELSPERDAIPTTLRGTGAREDRDNNKESLYWKCREDAIQPMSKCSIDQERDSTSKLSPL